MGIKNVFSKPKNQKLKTILVPNSFGIISKHPYFKKEVESNITPILVYIPSIKYTFNKTFIKD